MSYFELAPQERLSLAGRVRKVIDTVIGRKPTIGWKW